MKPVHIGVPVLRRYDLLRELLLSCRDSNALPESVVIIDNGKQPQKCAEVVAGLPFLVEVYEPDTPLGVAASWNYLIDRLPEERIITNDDITFTPTAIAAMVSTPGDLVFGYGYSCYLMRDSCVEKIGFFDEAISPGYAYWEDIDYDMRVRLAVAEGTNFIQVNGPCIVHHKGSQTNAIATPEEIQDHHRKFGIAVSNMRKKYAHVPYEQQHPALQPHLQKVSER